MTAPDVSVMNGRVFDRVPNIDPSSLGRFRLGVVEPETVAKVLPDHKTWERTVWLDQGAEGGCTGYSLAQLLALSPHQVAKIGNPFAEWIYFNAKKQDEFPGENYTGSSVLGAQKAAQAGGYITQYNWAATVEEIVAAIAFKSPVQLGINWYKSMFDVNSEGIITITSGTPLAGGHAITAGAIKKKGELIGLYQSWGKGWGQNGMAWISATDLSRLMSEEGEAAIPVKTNPLHWPNPLDSHARVDPGT